MKKSLIWLVCFGFVLTLGANSAFAGAAIKLGVDLNGEQELTDSGESIKVDVDTGLSLAAELFTSMNPNVDFGGGVMIQMPREATFPSGYEGKFNFLPIYGLIRLKGDSGLTDPYVIMQIGYNFFYGDSDYESDGVDLDGGLYYGLGAGLLFNRQLSLEFLYSVNNGEFETSGWKYDVENTQFTLSIGFNF